MEDIGKVISGVLSLVIYLALIPVLTNVLTNALQGMTVSDPTTASLISAIVALLPTVMIFKAIEKVFSAF